MGTRETFQFSRFTNNVPQCACISILQDSVVEGREFFEVGLSSFDSRVQLVLNSSTVIIADDDGMWYVSFQMYNISCTYNKYAAEFSPCKTMNSTWILIAAQLSKSIELYSTEDRKL